MKLLFLGDIVGKPGLQAVKKNLPEIKEDHELDLVVANAENVDNGSGLTPAQFDTLLESGVNVVTMGDHISRCFSIEPVLTSSDQIVRPANFPAKADGRGWVVFDNGAVKLAVISLVGRTFMRPVDCPFLAADRVLGEIADQADVILVDFHAEATADKQMMGRYLDGRVTAVLGTHTHVPTADSTILPGGTAFQCDVGMCGPYDSILGRNTRQVLKHTLTSKPTRYHVARGDVRLSGAVIDVNKKWEVKSIKRFEKKIEDA